MLRKTQLNELMKFLDISIQAQLLEESTNRNLSEVLLNQIGTKAFIETNMLVESLQLKDISNIIKLNDNRILIEQGKQVYFEEMPERRKSTIGLLCELEDRILEIVEHGMMIFNRNLEQLWHMQVKTTNAISLKSILKNTVALGFDDRVEVYLISENAFYHCFSCPGYSLDFGYCGNDLLFNQKYDQIDIYNATRSSTCCKILEEPTFSVPYTGTIHVVNHRALSISSSSILCELVIGNRDILNYIYISYW
jgi:hypothetical protein